MWSDVKSALRILNRLEPYDIFFVETPLDIDDLDGYAYLHDHSPIRIAAGEWQNTHFEFIDLADRGKIDELQRLHGTISLPQKPGLGVELNYEAIKKYVVV